MKNFLLILFFSTFLFFFISIFEKWENFKPLFFKEEKKIIKELEEPVDVIKSYNTILEHIYRFGGDERFLQRIPSSDFLKEEIAEDLYYLYSYKILQEMKLIKFNIIKKVPLTEEKYIIATEEEWEIFYKDLETGHPLMKKPQSFKIILNYLVVKKPFGWMVEDMKFEMQN